MSHWIGIDVGKTFHWASVLDDEGREVLSRKVLATEEDIEAFRSQVGALGAERAFFCVDMMGGPATLLEAVLPGHGERVFYLSGTALNRARDAYRGGEHKSDPRDARVIANQLRMRWRSLPEINPREESSAEMRALLAHRRDLVQDQVRRITRMRGLLLETFPGLEAILDLTKKDGPLVAVAKVATPGAARRLGEPRLTRWLKARGIRKAEELARRVVEAAKAQRHELPAAELKAELVAEIASEVLRTKGRLAALHERLEELVSANPKAEIVRSMPGMGTIFAAEFVAEVGDIGRFASADALAAAAGMVPVLRASGSTSHLRRSRRGNGVLKRALYRSAFSAIAHHGPSSVFYRRKRAEGKTHHQALIALARRRVNVLWAMLRDEQRYREQPPKAA